MSNLSSQFAGQKPPVTPTRNISTPEIGIMRSANTDGQTTVDEWAAALPETDARAAKINRYMQSNGEVPGTLSVTPSHSRLDDGHHRYKEAREAGVPFLPVVDNPADPRYKVPR
jgi:hypothetical protein